MKRKEIPIGAMIENLKAATTETSGGIFHGLTPRQKEDCLDAIETLKHCHPSSVPCIYKIVSLFLALSPINITALQHGLQGMTLTQSAISMGASKQAMHQRWEGQLMHPNQIIDAFMQYLMAVVAPKVSDPFKQFKIGMAVAGVGRKRVEAMAQNLFAGATQPDGTVDMAALKASILSGFSAAKSLPIAELGISFDVQDAEDFFSRLGA